MSEYITYFPVNTHLGEEILPSNTVLNESAFLVLKNKKANRKMFGLKDSGILKKDVATLLDKDAYSTIFHEKESRELVFSSLKRISIPYCEYEAIEYFRVHDFYTYEHLLAVFSLSTLICSLLELNSDPSNAFLGSLSHDIGKCSVPPDILRKQNSLTHRERQHIEHHTMAGYALLTYYSGVNNSASAIIARDHHENRSGSGYPVGKTQVDLQTEIVIACDIYDALLSPRPYRREAFNNRAALEELTKRTLDGQISEEIIKVLVASNRMKKSSWYECKISKEYRGPYPKENYYGSIQEENESKND
jgi:HD-GYP domain-containing protein (c-di-GMP phosphodiesterase class II)